MLRAELEKDVNRAPGLRRLPRRSPADTMPGFRLTDLVFPRKAALEHGLHGDDTETSINSTLIGSTAARRKQPIENG